MIFFVLTHPKRKIAGLLTCVLLGFLLVYLLPAGYHFLTDANALADYAAVEETILNEQYQEKINNNNSLSGSANNEKTKLVYNILYGDEIFSVIEESLD